MPYHEIQPEPPAGRIHRDKIVDGDADILKGDVFVEMPDGRYRRAHDWELPPDVRALRERVLNATPEQEERWEHEAKEFEL